MDNKEQLAMLCAAWREAKNHEVVAAGTRVDIENQIVALTGKKDEGSQTHQAPGFSITVTGKMSRKLDIARWDAIKSQIPLEMHPIKTKTELDEVGVKWLQANRTDLYAILAGAITVKPAKTAVECKEKQTEEV